MNIDVKLINFLRFFCARECAYKLDILARTGELTSRTRNARDIFSWVKNGIQGVNKFRCAFAATERNLQHTLFSVCRTSIQFRYIYD